MSKALPGFQSKNAAKKVQDLRKGKEKKMKKVIRKIIAGASKN